MEIIKYSPSLVPRPEKGRRKGPGFHCLRMRLIAVEFHRHRGRSIYVRTACDVKADTKRYVVRTVIYVSEIWRAFLQTLIVLSPMPSSG